MWGVICSPFFQKAQPIKTVQSQAPSARTAGVATLETALVLVLMAELSPGAIFLSGLPTKLLRGVVNGSHGLGTLKGGRNLLGTADPKMSHAASGSTRFWRTQSA